MLKHIVSWTLADHAEGADKATNAALLASELAALADCVPGILAFEVVLPQPGLEAGFDMMLYSEFADTAALQAYIEYPPHKQFGARMAKMRTERRAFDYDTASLPR